MLTQCDVKGLNITIRDFVRADLFRPDYVEMMNNLSRTVIPTEENADLFMKWMGLTSKKIWMATHTEEHSMLGTISILHDIKASRGVVMALRIEEMVTHPRYERHGVATALIDQAIEYAKGFQATETLLVYKIGLACADGVHEEKNHISFYERAGFVHEEAEMVLRLAS